MAERASIVAKMRLAYWAPTRRRHYATLKQALHAEAVARIRRRYPREYAEPDVGHPGWSWREMPTAEKLLRRMVAYLRMHMAVTHG